MGPNSLETSVSKAIACKDEISCIIKWSMREIQDYSKKGKKNRRKKQSVNFLATLGIKGSSMGIKKSINNGLLKPALPSFLRGHTAYSLSSRHSSPSSSIWFIPERCGVRGNGNQHFSSSRVFPLPARPQQLLLLPLPALPSANPRTHPAQLLAVFLGCFLGNKKKKKDILILTNQWLLQTNPLLHTHSAAPPAAALFRQLQSCVCRFISGVF